MADDSNLPSNVRPMAQGGRLIVESPLSVWDTGKFEHLGRIATVMAGGGLMPESLCYEGPKNNRQRLPDDIIRYRAFQIAEQAERWNMSPFAVMGSCSYVNGGLMYEGKLVAAAIERMLGTRLSYEFGIWNAQKVAVTLGVEPPGTDQLGVVVSGVLPGETAPRTVEGFVGGWRTTRDGSPWAAPSGWRRQLRYRGAREWARAHSPGVMLGVVTEDDIDDAVARSVELRAEPPRTLAAAVFGADGSAKISGPEGQVTDQPAAAANDPAPRRQAAASRKATPPPPVDAAAEGSQPSEPQATDEVVTSDGEVISADEAARRAAAESDTADQRTDLADPKPDSADTRADSAGAGAGPSAEPPARDDAAFMAVFEPYRLKVAAADSWLGVKPAVIALLRSPEFAKGHPDFRAQALALAYERTVEIKDPVTPDADPTFFRLWLRSRQEGAESPDAVFRRLCRSKAYQGTSDVEKDVIGDEIAEFG